MERRRSQRGPKRTTAMLVTGMLRDMRMQSAMAAPAEEPTAGEPATGRFTRQPDTLQDGDDSRADINTRVQNIGRLIASREGMVSASSPANRQEAIIPTDQSNQQ